jgi:hypothetical protein
LLPGAGVGPLLSSAARGNQALIELTKPDLFDAAGNLLARQQEVGIRWLRVLDARSLSLHDTIGFRNFGLSCSAQVAPPGS